MISIWPERDGSIIELEKKLAFKNICLYLPLAITTDQAKRLESSVEI